MPNASIDPNDESHLMKMAIELARQGEGHVEPNPMVGCVLVRDGDVVGQGFHEKFGGPHAEINAIVACERTAGATAHVTLEPCCHTGKTGPCTTALIEAGIAKVVVATVDPNPKVAGKGIERLKLAGIDVHLGLCETDAKDLIAPFQKRLETGMPWVIAKWAMTLDGRIASSTGSSQWISNQESRKIVHQIRSRMDAILVGIHTAVADDPMLTARPSAIRQATRVVMDSKARLSTDSKLVKSAQEVPVVIFTADEADHENVKRLADAGCQVIQNDADNHQDRMIQALNTLGKMGCTNLLVEGGRTIFGSLNDANLIDEVHCFVGPKIIGGESSKPAFGGLGIGEMIDAKTIYNQQTTIIGNDVYISGRIENKNRTSVC